MGDRFRSAEPPADFDVRGLTAHLVAVMNRIAVLGAGGDFFSTTDAIDGVADADWAHTYQQLAEQIERVWSDDTALTRIIDLPWAQLPGSIMLMTYVNEVSVHTWDLAKATGQQPEWDEGVLQMAYQAIRHGLPAEGRAEAPFADVVVVPDDAPLIDRLVAWNGRTP